jgi:hypothetical protein
MLIIDATSLVHEAEGGVSAVSTTDATIALNRPFDSRSAAGSEPAR